MHECKYIFLIALFPKSNYYRTTKTVIFSKQNILFKQLNLPPLLHLTLHHFLSRILSSWYFFRKKRRTMEYILLCFRIADRSAARSDDGLAERILASFVATQLVPGRSAQHPHAADEPQG